MKTSLRFVFTVMFGLGSASTPGLAQTSDLIASYPFSGNTLDQSGYGNHGTSYGGVSATSDRFGNPNAALQFNGYGYVLVNNSSSLQLGTNYTISTWFRISASGPSDWVGIVSKAIASLDGYAGPRVMLNERSGTFYYADIAIQLNRWYHAALVVGDTQMKWYLDGVVRSAGGAPPSSWTMSNGNPVSIGSQNATFRGFNGAVDDVRIYNRPLGESEVWSLYTGDPPPAPELIAPANGVTGISTSPTMSWYSSATATSYRLQVSTSSSFTTLVLDQGGIAGTSYQVGALSYNTVYYWRVSASGLGGTSGYSSTRVFTTVLSPPVAPLLASPADGATGVSTTPVFTWNGSAEASSYRLQVSNSSSFIGLIVDQAGITATSYNSSALSSNTVYYWRVNASNAGGTSGYSSTRSFTTLPAIPAAPVLLSPADGSTQVAINPVFNWNPVPGAVSYRLEVSTSSSFGTLTFNQTGIASTSYQAAGLGYSTVYYWRVGAENTAGGSPYSSTWSFTTAPITIPTGTLQVLVSDAENWGNAGSGAIVQLFNAGGSLIGTQTTPSSSIATFSDIPSTTTYSYRVYVPPLAGTPWTATHYWGMKTGVAIATGQTTSDNFIRNAPYAPTITAYDNATNAEIANGTVLIGTTIRIELVIKNPMYAGATSQVSSGRVILDRDMAPGYESDQMSTYQSYAIGETRNVAFYYTPSATGAYSYSAGVATMIGGNATSTEGSGWGGPLFTVVEGDIVAPGAPVNLAASPSGWQNRASFTIDWTSPSDPSGVAAAWYKVGSVPVSATDGSRSTNKPMSVIATAEGGQNIYVWLEDGVGNKDHGARGLTNLYYDGTPPTSGTISINAGAPSTSSLVVTLNGLGASDAGGSGLVTMRFSNNDTVWSTWEPVAATKPAWNLSHFGGTSTVGQKTVYAQYGDNAGNSSGVVSAGIVYQGADVTAPDGPLSLAASPAGWTNANPFTIDWTNPNDPSGIVAAWYKLGTGPTVGTDGTRTTQKPFTVSATVEGGQTLFVWLEDGAGNKDHNSRTTTQLFFDESAPSGGTISINNGAATTASPIVTLNGLGATDAGGSGVSQMRFSNDVFAWSAWEGYSATKAAWDLTADGGGSAGGEKTVSVQYRDAAGNVSQTAADKIVYVTTSVLFRSSEVPHALDLHQNYPNPFNPTTVVRFDVPVSGDVSIVVVNVLGEVVSSLAEGHHDPGSYAVRLDASKFPSGIYLYRMQAGNTVLTKRMVLLK